MKKALTLVALCLAASTAWAAPKTVTLSVPSMYCPVCPITVRKALSNVPGVARATVDFDKRQATVTFDDARTDVAALTRATANAGFPSTLVGQVK